MCVYVVLKYGDNFLIRSLSLSLFFSRSRFDTAVISDDGWESRLRYMLASWPDNRRINNNNSNKKKKTRVGGKEETQHK